MNEPTSSHFGLQTASATERGQMEVERRPIPATLPIPDLYKRLSKAQADAKAIDKASHNAHHNYDYASAEDVIDACRSALSQNGLSFSLHRYDWEAFPVETDDTLTLIVEYWLACDEGQRTLVQSKTPIVIGKGRPWDKASSIAKTVDEAYSLRAVLLLPRIELAADIEPRDDTGFDPTKQEQERKEKQDERTRLSTAKKQLAVLGRQIGKADCLELVGRSANLKTIEQFEEAVEILRRHLDAQSPAEPLDDSDIPY